MGVVERHKMRKKLAPSLGILNVEEGPKLKECQEAFRNFEKIKPLLESIEGIQHSDTPSVLLTCRCVRLLLCGLLY